MGIRGSLRSSFADHGETGTREGGSYFFFQHFYWERVAALKDSISSQEAMLNDYRTKLGGATLRWSRLFGQLSGRNKLKAGSRLLVC